MRDYKQLKNLKRTIDHIAGKKNKDFRWRRGILFFLCALPFAALFAYCFIFDLWFIDNTNSVVQSVKNRQERDLRLAQLSRENYWKRTGEADPFQVLESIFSGDSLGPGSHDDLLRHLRSLSPEKAAYFVGLLQKFELSPQELLAFIGQLDRFIRRHDESEQAGAAKFDTLIATFQRVDEQLRTLTDRLFEQDAIADAASSDNTQDTPAVLDPTVAIIRDILNEDEEVGDRLLDQLVESEDTLDVIDQAGDLLTEFADDDELARFLATLDGRSLLLFLDLFGRLSSGARDRLLTLLSGLNTSEIADILEILSDLNRNNAEDLIALLERLSRGDLNDLLALLDSLPSGDVDRVIDLVNSLPGDTGTLIDVIADFGSGRDDLLDILEDLSPGDSGTLLDILDDLNDGDGENLLDIIDGLTGGDTGTLLDLLDDLPDETVDDLLDTLDDLTGSEAGDLIDILDDLPPSDVDDAVDVISDISSTHLLRLLDTLERLTENDQEALLSQFSRVNFEQEPDILNIDTAVINGTPTAANTAGVETTQFITRASGRVTRIEGVIDRLDAYNTQTVERLIRTGEQFDDANLNRSVNVVLRSDDAQATRVLNVYDRLDNVEDEQILSTFDGISDIHLEAGLDVAENLSDAGLRRSVNFTERLKRDLGRETGLATTMRFINIASKVDNPEEGLEIVDEQPSVRARRISRQVDGHTETFTGSLSTRLIDYYRRVNVDERNAGAEALAGSGDFALSTAERKYRTLRRIDQTTTPAGEEILFGQIRRRLATVSLPNDRNLEEVFTVRLPNSGSGPSSKVRIRKPKRPVER